VAKFLFGIPSHLFQPFMPPAEYRNSRSQ